MNLAIAVIICLLFIGLLAYLCLPRRVTIPDSQTGSDSIDALLPQTQCGDCGYAGCRPYADAIMNHQAGINRCLPGGIQTMERLSRLTGMPAKPLYKAGKTAKRLAVIDETRCIGCVKCIRACPVDAIIGAPKQMHSVINAYCTGCELCIAPCPVDCIEMVTARH